jgi:hypothetical protein
MDASTTSGFGAGMMGVNGQRPNMGQIKNMMSGNAPSFAHTLELRLASKTKAPAAPTANHLIPPNLQMGPSLPLLTPAAAKPVKETYGMPPGYEKPKGRMLIYWAAESMPGPASRQSSTSPRWPRDRCRRAWPRWPMPRARRAFRTARPAMANGRTPRTAVRYRQADL